MIKVLLKKFYLAWRKMLLKWLFRPRPVVRIEASSLERILLIRLDRIGDFVASIPAIKAIKAIFPKAKITMLLSRSTFELAKLVPEIDEAIVYQGFFSSLSTLKDRKFNLAVDLLMDYTLKTALLANLCKAKVSSGFDIEGRGQLFDLSFAPFSQQKPMSSHLLDLSRYLAGLSGKPAQDFRDIEPVLTLSLQSREFNQRFLKEKGIKEEELILGIAPGAKFPSQCWKEENFAWLADRLVEKYKARIIIIASKPEDQKLKRIVSLMKSTPVIASGLSLVQLAGLISVFKLMVANNSGPLHMAAALGVATVSTMGPTVPYLWWPQGKNHMVIRKDLSCSPCNRSVCRVHECLESISLEEMEKAVDTLMARI